ncbi:MAG: helix-hairpin-helix domain-containing protein, partial [Candidatus Bathyarchaeia archaeon]
DEAYLDVTQKVNGDFDAVKDLVQKMKLAVKSSVGITFSVGVGPNKLVAKIAADRQKPDGLTIIKPEDVQRFLSPLPVDQLIGIGRKTAAKMGELGIRTIGDLASYDVQKLVAIFGKKLGIYFYNAANGIDNEPVHELGETESISRIATLKEDTRDLARIMERATQLIEEIHKDAAPRRVNFRQISVMAVMTDLSVKSRARMLETATSDIDVLKRTVPELFEKLLSTSQLEIRRVGVKIAHFSREEAAQQRLTRFFKE